MIHKRSFSIDRLVLHILYILLIGPNVAYKVMTENISLIKSSGMGLIFLADNLLENKIISLEKKKEVTDRLTGRGENERIDELLQILMTSIEVEERVFDIFLEILEKKNTRQSRSLAKKLLNGYCAGPNKAYKVMIENISLIKSSGIGLIFLADNLLENKIISLEKKKEVTDRLTGRGENERIDELLQILMTSIEVEERVFDIFLEILEKENTEQSCSLAKKLLNAYCAS